MKKSQLEIRFCLFAFAILLLFSCHGKTILKSPAVKTPPKEENRPLEEIKPISLAKTFSRMIDSVGFEKGIAFYNSMKRNKNYFIDENEMNMVSYELLQSERSDEAIDVLKLGIERFPFAYNLYDSYGEVLNSIGETEKSIVQYRKSVTLNPQNKNGIKMLNKLGVIVDEKELYLLKGDSSWGVEMFTFPISFAKDITYRGTEEAYFPRGWRDTLSMEFWSYAFTWRIDVNYELSEEELELNLYKYFHGLMTNVNKQRDLVIPETIIQLDKAFDGQFTGIVKMHDSFTTEKELILNVAAKQHICPRTKMSVVVFRFSPKPYETMIWTKLNQLSLSENHCEL